jgi:mono/diheme cytochrome c family protein
MLPMIANRKNLGRLSPVVRRLLAAGAAVAAAAAVICLPSGCASAADTNTNAPVAAASAPKAADVPAAKPDKKADPQPKAELSGVELYAINCNRCHPERYPAEFTDGQWKTIMLHMRVRANLPAKQARLVLNYLQDESGHY